MPTEDKANVLVVDDRPDKLLVIETLLAELPVAVVRAHSGREALRHLLNRDFALILLDVNMPGMDGFETAELIRARKQSEHIPIIFVTAYSNDIFMEKGYSLGAVDYILQPVVAETLRAKVMVFVELYRQNQQLAKQASTQLQRAAQLQKLAAAAAAINASKSMETMLQIVTDTARDLIAAHQAITIYFIDQGNAHSPQSEAFSSFSEKYAHWRNRHLELNLLAATIFAQARTVTRLTEEQLHHHQDWAIVKQAHVPTTRGILAAPLTGHEKGNHGIIYLSEKVDGEFTEDDEAILTQLAQTAAIAIENAISFDAREANRAKDQFLAVLSHELRTPLTPVIAALSALHNDPRIPRDVHADLDLIRRNVELEANLIDDLLDLTRISKGKIELRMDRVDAHFLLSEALAICQSDIAAKSLNTQVLLRATQFHVWADLTRLHQVFWNLIKNAVKFTSPGGSIEITSENPRDDVLVIRVTDNGIGIDPVLLPHIFNAFEQGERSITRQFGGLGLGLTITKALVDAHGAAITASSAGRGTGSTFTITFPIQRQSTVECAHPPIPSASDNSLRSVRILLIEDHADTSLMLARLLTKEGHEVCVALNAAAAMQAYQDREFDLVISDLGLPDRSGIDLMRDIQAHRPVTAIALSGFGMENDIWRSREAGFQAHLTKPVNIPKLLECIQRTPSSNTPPRRTQANRLN